MKRDKLIARFLSVPKDLTWNELIKILSCYGYYELATGMTGGSRRRFADADKNIINLHKPHPSNLVKQYAIRQIIDILKEKRKIENE